MELIHLKEKIRNETLINQLEMLLDQAKKGNLLSLAFAGQLNGKDYLSGFAIGEHVDVFGLIGSLEYVKQQVIKKEIE